MRVVLWMNIHSFEDYIWNMSVGDEKQTYFIGSKKSFFLNIFKIKLNFWLRKNIDVFFLGLKITDVTKTPALKRTHFENYIKSLS